MAWQEESLAHFRVKASVMESLAPLPYIYDDA